MSVTLTPPKTNAEVGRNRHHSVAFSWIDGTFTKRKKTKKWVVDSLVISPRKNKHVKEGKFYKAFSKKKNIAFEGKKIFPLSSLFLTGRKET